MLNNKILIKTVGLFSMASFCLSMTPFRANAYNLAPLSFNRMYNLAQNGEVEALRASVRRGMNIDSTNQNGDTGLCVAAQNRDAYTYNAFRAAGANPHHPCVQKISYYEDFVNSSKAVSVTATPREAYGQMGKESYKISSTTWWILGGLAVGGGIAALAMGGGGGGSSKSDSGSTETNDYIGKNLGSSGKIYNSTSGNTSNSSLLDVSNTNIKKIAELNYNENPLEAGKYMNVGLKAINGGSYTNNENTKISINAGSTAMAAVNNSNVTNNGYINADAFNSSVAMIASNNSVAYNNGKGVIQNPDSNGINLNFSGYTENNTIIGMYADDNSQIINTGEINGSATTAISDPTKDSENNNSIFGNSSSSTTTTSKVTAVSGTIVGMETMIINSGKQALNNTNIALNSGTIKLSAGDAGAAASEIKVNIIGMGSYLDDGFLNGSKNIQRAEKSILNNSGIIDLGYTGSYTFDSTKTLRKGLGGIVGMRADTNATANNNKNINITLDDKSSSSSSSGGSSSSGSVAVAAGMQSIHSGTINNNQNATITIQTNGDNQRVSYGMLAVEGSGTVSGLYTTTKPTVTNNGNINLNASNGYGMASYNGGTLINGESGVITLGNNDTSTLYTNNVGMYGSGDSTITSLVNNGQINIYSSSSTAMKNDYSGGTSITNSGTIHIYNNAVNSNVFGGNYSNIVNDGTIIYEITNKGSSSDETEAKNLLNLQQNVISTKSPSKTSSVTSSETETITNNGTITLTSADTAAMIVESTQGTATNTGTINLNKNEYGMNYGNSGMHLTSDVISVAQIVNKGTINVNTGYSTGMSSVAEGIANMINDKTGIINVSNSKSFGMYATGNSHITNNGIINIYGDGNTAIYSAGTGKDKEKSIIKNNIIKIFGKNATVFRIEGTAEVSESGNIIVCDPSVDGSSCKSDAADSLTYYLVTGSSGDLTVTKSQSITSGTLIKLEDTANVTVNKDVTLSLTKKGTIISAKNGTGTITNNGTLRLNNTNDSTAVNVGDATFNNNGTIEIIQTLAESSTGNTAVSVGSSGTFNNGGEISVESSSGVGIASAGTTTNSGTLNVSGSNGTGINISDGKTTNSGGIVITGNGGSAVLVDGGAFDNTGTITVSSANSGTGIEINKGTVKNESKITISGSDSYGVKVADGDFTNSGSLIIGNLSNYVSNSTGIEISGANGKATIDSGEITVYGSSSYGAKVVGGTFTNKANITIGSSVNYVSNSTGIEVSGGTTENEGEINVYGSSSYAAKIAGGTFNNKANITIGSSTNYANNSTGIYVSDGTATNEGEQMNIYGSNSYGAKVAGGTFNNKANITVNSESNGTGIEVTKGTAINDGGEINIYGSSSYGAKVTDGTFNNKGNITINSASGTGIEVSGTNGTATNEGGTISISGSNSYGAKVTSGIFNNKGNINVGSSANYVSNSAGIYVSGGSAGNESGQITVYGSGSYGAKVDGGTFSNNGTITIYQLSETSTTSYGIYVSGSGKAINNGTITVNNGAVKCYGIKCEDESEKTSTQALAMLVSNNSSFVNNGTVNYDSDLDFNAATKDNSTITIGKNGTYVAKSLKGTVTADANITQNGFEKTYRNDNSFVGDDNGLNIVSGSYMFNAQKQKNESGNTDVIMTMKSFDETVNNKELSDYLSVNYSAQKGEGVFNTLKSQSTALSFNNALNREFGFSMIPNLAKQDLDLLANINRAANDDILEQTDETKRAKVNVLTYQQEFDGKHNVSGYKDKVKAVYGFSDYQIANNWRAGFGAAVARSDSDFDDDSTRYGNMLEIFAPFTYINNNFRAMAKPKLGFNKGHYRRSGVDKAYKADLTNYYYGFDAEARQTVDFDFTQIEPVVGADITKIKIDDIKESNNGLKADSDTITSVQSVVGMDIKKEFEFNKEQSLLLTAGGRYIHEFGNKYSTMATINNMLGAYNINSNRLQRDKGLLSVKAQYDYQKLSLSATVNAPLEQKSNVYYLFDLGYKF